MRGVLTKKRRRIVSNENRKRALFSCDRCKKRKTACKRLHSDNLRYDHTTPCIQCSRKGLECTTTIPRKKRFVGPVENVGLHYKCLTSLLAGLFPERDIYNLEHLVELGKSFKIDMPDLDAEQEEEEDENQSDEDSDTGENGNNHTDLKQSLSHSIHRDITVETVKLESKVEETPVERSDKRIDSETLIVDKGGNVHYIGSTGTVALLKSLCDIILRKSFNLKPSQPLRELRDSRLETITSSHNVGETNMPSYLAGMDLTDLKRLPMSNLLPREQADALVDVFFKHVHPMYFVFIEAKFKEKYELFWSELDSYDETFKSSPESRLSSDSGVVTTSSPSPAKKLSHTEIGCIYMVWILANRYNYTKPYSRTDSSQLDDSTVAKLIDIIKLTLPDIVLTPSVNGIRLVYLLSVFLASTKVRESAWILVELAITQVRSLGLHRTSLHVQCSPTMAEERQRLFWALIKTRVFSSSSFGRVPGLNGEEMDVDIPTLSDLKPDDPFKVYYKHNLELSKIMYDIMITRIRLNLKSDPFSFSNTERTLLVKKRLDAFWQTLSPDWQDPYSHPISMYKIKINVFYQYYHICLTLPFYFHFANNSSHRISKGDPTMTVLITGIESAFKIAELTTLNDEQGFFNGTLSSDVFFAYNAVLVLALTYILFKTNGSASESLIDFTYLDTAHGINLASLLNALNLVRRMIFKNSYRLNGTAETISEVIETILQDLGIVDILIQEFGAPATINLGDKSSKQHVESLPKHLPLDNDLNQDYPVPEGFPTTHILSEMPNINAPAIENAMMNHNASLPQDFVDGQFIDMLLGDLFGSTGSMEAGDFASDPSLSYWQPLSRLF
ncbi:unnamed protein product [Kuraishia capsulata CBS 1993]|uniref:Zn(2)-C6 fungal-type domain-containing protein n=1 Tax=Kuraishia capsulata CBS 1993 TaxID=1382522 RepID=W6MUM8_9ASCO|nr:uncharacterized protein KUCA_T00005400001 [Kuraishia capsulata CBS 1993]CDK29412.1 unnamed protein product [Kuraishia capsulata CBS 1993]